MPLFIFVRSVYPNVRSEPKNYIIYVSSCQEKKLKFFQLNNFIPKLKSA